MNYGSCNLSVVPIRIDSDDRSEMISQLLFSDSFEIIGKSKQWIKIKLTYDNIVGWIDNKQYLEISKEYYKEIQENSSTISNELIDFIEDTNHNLTSIVLGTSLPFYNNSRLELNGTNFRFDGNITNQILSKKAIVKTAFLYLNTPYLWGGKTPFGIDCSGFTQMVYKINGHQLFRDAVKQATQGEVLSFIEESTPGDLAFFDDSEGNIIHTGIVLADNYIIHASGKVRVDRLDQSGIYNAELRKHTHKLRVIKQIFKE